MIFRVLKFSYVSLVHTLTKRGGKVNNFLMTYCNVANFEA